MKLLMIARNLDKLVTSEGLKPATTHCDTSDNVKLSSLAEMLFCNITANVITNVTQCHREEHQ